MLKNLLFLILIPLIAWCVFIEPNMIVVNKQNISFPEYPETPKLKIVIISDIHTGMLFNREDKLKRIVSLVNAQNPDIILGLGDYDIFLMEELHVNTAKVSKELGRLKAKYGVYTILGNHDGILQSKRTPEGKILKLSSHELMIKGIINKAKLNLLDNQWIIIEKDGKKLVLLGLTDDKSQIRVMAQRLFFKKQVNKPYDNLKDIIPKLPKDYPVILMNHSPDIFPSVPKRISLTLSGHTHGGQIAIPFINNLITPSIYNNRYAKGLITENERRLFVTSGLGNSPILPARLGIPPEVVVLNLNPDKNSTAH